MKGELETIVDIQRRLGKWNSRDFADEMRIAVSQFTEFATSPLPPRPNLVRLFRSLERVERSYQKIFGEFCELQNLAGSPRLQKIESEILDLAGRKEEAEKKSRLIAEILRGISSSPPPSSETKAAARAYSARLLSSRPRGNKRGRQLQNAWEKVSQLENKYSRSFARSSNIVVFRSRRQLKGLSEPEILRARLLAKATGSAGWGVALDETVEQEVLEKLKSPSSRERIRRAVHLREKKLAPLARSLAIARRHAASLAGYQSWSELKERALGKATTPAAWAMLREVAQASVKKRKSPPPRPPLSFSPLSIWSKGCVPLVRKCFGLRLDEVRGAVLYHRSVKLYKVVSSKNACLGFILLDLFSRPGKRAGAWTSGWQECRTRTSLPVIGLVCNLGEKCSFSGAEDIFHELGHAIHAILAASSSPFLTPLSIPADLVEIPSLVTEKWIMTPATRNILNPALGELSHSTVLQHLAAEKARENLSSALAAAIDLLWHSSRLIPFSKMLPLARRKLGIPSSLEVDPTYSPSVFPHIFGEDYDARYFSYLWCDREAQIAIDRMTLGNSISRPRILRFFKSLRAQNLVPETSPHRSRKSPPLPKSPTPSPTIPPSSPLRTKEHASKSPNLPVP